MRKVVALASNRESYDVDPCYDEVDSEDKVMVVVDSIYDMNTSSRDLNEELNSGYL